MGGTLTFSERPEQVAVNQHVYYPQQYGQAFQDLTSYMQKLQQQGLIQPIDHNSQPFVLPHNSYGYVHPSYSSYQVANEQQNVATAAVQDLPSDAPENFSFDELSTIQLIPIIITQLKSNELTDDEKSSFEKIFGNSLWSLMVDEASRTNDVEMNPLLKTIMSSEEVSLAKRDIENNFGNDIYKNSLRRVYRGSNYSGLKSQKPYISLDDDKKVLSPSERLLNMIAAIVHKSNVMEKSRQKAEREAKLKHKQKMLRKKNKKSMESNPLGIIKPRQRYVDRILGINRMKRSIIKFGTDLQDMKAFLDHVNEDSDLLYDDEEQLVESADNNSNYDDDDEYLDDDYESYDFHPQEQNQLSLENDYSFDSYPRRHRNIFDDYENGSVNEFIDLARQRDRREHNFDDMMQNDEEYDEDDYEAYYDN
ncbi:hypothetical protein ACKWTF_001369 [Chironomus riparius]